MKCYLPKCGNPDGCFDSGECYWTGVYEVHEARRLAAELSQIPDENILAFGCDAESKGLGPACREWCHLPGCAFSLKLP